MGILALVAAMALVWLLAGEQTESPEEEVRAEAVPPPRHASSHFAPSPASMPVVWAFVPYAEASEEGKIRPVCILSRRDGVLRGLPMYSRQGPTTPDQTYVFVSADSTCTFDHKAAPSWVRVGAPIDLPTEAIAYPGRQPGEIRDADARRVWAMMGEFGLRGYITEAR